MKNFSLEKKLILLVLAFLVVAIVVTTSYAWFTATVSGNPNNPNVVTSGKMEVTYVEGTNVNTTNNMLPGQSVTKTFSVSNTGDVATVYDIYLNDVVNTFVNKNELVYTLTSTGGGTTINQTVAPSVNTKIASNVALAKNATHTYTLTITFLETSANQDDNKGASFSARVSLVEAQQNNNNSGSGENNSQVAQELTFPLTLYNSAMYGDSDYCNVGSRIYNVTSTDDYHITGDGDTIPDLSFETYNECASYIESEYDGSDDYFCGQYTLSAISGTCATYAHITPSYNSIISSGTSVLAEKLVIDSNGYLTSAGICSYAPSISNDFVCMNFNDNFESDYASYFGYNSSTGSSSKQGVNCSKYDMSNDEIMYVTHHECYSNGVQMDYEKDNNINYINLVHAESGSYMCFYSGNSIMCDYN